MHLFVDFLENPLYYLNYLKIQIIKGVKDMSTLLKSTFETYLFDEEVEFDLAEQQEVAESEERTQYPKGFFSSL